MEDKKLIEEARAEVENIQNDVQTQLATFEEEDNEENKRLLADAREIEAAEADRGYFTVAQGKHGSRKDRREYDPSA